MMDAWPAFPAIHEVSTLKHHPKKNLENNEDICKIILSLGPSSTLKSVFDPHLEYNWKVSRNWVGAISVNHPIKEVNLCTITRPSFWMKRKGRGI
jgi:hypothetical protein